MRTLFLDALKHRPCERPPVWLMRQAGRYLPQYRQFREKYSLHALFRTPELACKITLLPIDLFDLDAAIVFSDILTVVEGLGFKLFFPDKGGPYAEPLLTSAKEVDAIEKKDPQEAFVHLTATIRLLKKELKVPLIGFCGGPYTIASYLIDREKRDDWKKTKEWIYRDPDSFHRLLQKITEATIDCLALQIEAGVDAIQIFDSWAGILSHEHFHQFSLAYLKQQVDFVQKKGIPAIVFCRGSCLFAKEIATILPDAISFDWHRKMSELREELPRQIALQGNLDPDLLLGPKEEVERATEKLLISMRKEKGFIVNLGHGVSPDAKVDNVRALVDTVRAFR